MEGRLPNLLIIGAMKSGTSSLHDYLALHPDIFMSTPKEIHFFTNEFYDPNKLDEYKNHFITNKKIAGTTPQNYTKCHNHHFKSVPERIKKHIPDVKMIYIVRDPIKRYTSHIFESSFTRPPVRNLTWEQKSSNFIKTGMYYMQIQAFLNHFKKEQIHILSLEDLQENKLVELNKIFRFLEVDEMNDVSIFDFITNDVESKEYPYIIKTNFFFRLGNKISTKLTKIVGDKIRDKYFSHLMKKRPLPKEEEVKIKAIIKDDVEKFRAFTEKSFSNWNI